MSTQTLNLVRRIFDQKFIAIINLLPALCQVQLPGTPAIQRHSFIHGPHTHHSHPRVPRAIFWIKKWSVRHSISTASLSTVRCILSQHDMGQGSERKTIRFVVRMAVCLYVCMPVCMHMHACNATHCNVMKCNVRRCNVRQCNIMEGSVR